MPLDRVPGQPSMASLIHVDRWRGRRCLRGPHSSPRYLRQSAFGPQPRHVGADYLAQTFPGQTTGGTQWECIAFGH